MTCSITCLKLNFVAPIVSLKVPSGSVRLHRDEVVEVHVGGGPELERLEADVVERLVVEAEGHVAVLHQLVHREDGVVRLHHHLGHLRGRHDAVGAHDAVWELLADLADEQGSQAGAGATACKKI